MKNLSILLLLCLTNCISSPESKKVSETKENTKQNITTDTAVKNSEVKIKEDNTIYNIDSIDVKPEFEGGIKKLQKFLRNNIKYPEDELQVKGIVDVNFVVEKDGYIRDIKVTKDAGYGTGNEAIRVLKKCPKWIPGTNNHKLVRVRYYLTIPIDVYHNE